MIRVFWLSSLRPRARTWWQRLLQRVPAASKPDCAWPVHWP